MTELQIRLRFQEIEGPAEESSGIDLGIQDKKKNVLPGQTADDGSGVFDCVVDVHENGGKIDFKGAVVHGTPSERFLYLSWKRRETDGAPWAQRIKIPLAGLTADIVDEGAREGRCAEADITRRRPHDTTPIRWVVTTL